jgi:hypothetical protein
MRLRRLEAAEYVSLKLTTTPEHAADKSAG